MVEMTSKGEFLWKSWPLDTVSLLFEGHTELHTHHRIKPCHVLHIVVASVAAHHVLNVANAAHIASSNRDRQYVLLNDAFSNPWHPCPKSRAVMFGMSFANSQSASTFLVDAWWMCSTVSNLSMLSATTCKTASIVPTMC